MALANGGALVAAIGVLVLALLAGVLLGWRTTRPVRDTDAAAAIARAERVRSLPAFQRSVRRRMAALTAVLALGAVTLLVAGVVVARPQSIRTVDPVASHRDIVLCLDVSGSMRDVNDAVLGQFVALAEEFRGERLGLTIFDGSAVQVFPLTSDDRYVREQLRAVRSGDSGAARAGTRLGSSSSLIGDGLAACAMHFDHPDLERSRSIILATDNHSGPDPIVSLDEAAAYAAASGVRVYTINPDDGKDAQSAELAAAAGRTGGRGYDLGASDTIAGVVADVRRDGIAQLRGKPQAVSTDAPAPWAVALILLAGAFVVVVERVRL